jgi:hypothetical protein
VKEREGGERRRELSPTPATNGPVALIWANGKNNAPCPAEKSKELTTETQRHREEKHREENRTG